MGWMTSLEAYSFLPTVALPLRTPWSVSTVPSHSSLAKGINYVAVTSIITVIELGGTAATLPAFIFESWWGTSHCKSEFSWFSSMHPSKYRNNISIKLPPLLRNYFLLNLYRLPYQDTRYRYGQCRKMNRRTTNFHVCKTCRRLETHKRKHAEIGDVRV